MDLIRFGIAEELRPAENPRVLAGYIVCVDPGHPSEVSDGLTVLNGTTETHINWAVALKLTKLLREAGATVKLTKQTELQMVPNVERSRIAAKAGADLMLRIHADTGANSGYAVFYPDAAGHHGGVTGPSAWVRQESRRAAHSISAGLSTTMRGKLRNLGVKTDRQTKVGGELGALIGSIHSVVPVVTVEMGFLNNPKDAEVLKSASGQEALAQGMFEGIRRYLSERSP